MKTTTKKQPAKSSLKTIQIQVAGSWVAVCQRRGKELQTAMRRLARAGWIARVA
jgi:hypothetical protein